MRKTQRPVRTPCVIVAFLGELTAGFKTAQPYRQTGLLLLVQVHRGCALIGSGCCWCQLSYAMKTQLMAPMHFLPFKAIKAHWKARNDSSRGHFIFSRRFLVPWVVSLWLKRAVSRCHQRSGVSNTPVLIFNLESASLPLDRRRRCRSVWSGRPGGRPGSSSDWRGR